MYKKLLFIILCNCLIFSQSNADDLMKALSDAYYKNPELNAERENILVSKEDLKISRSEFLPSITITGSKSEQSTDKLTNRSGSDTAITDVDTEIQKVTIEQTLFQGLGGKADLDKSKIGINLAEANLLKKEQEIILTAAEAYSGLTFAKKKLDINKENLSLLERQVETDQNRLENGLITLADLAQSESSLAGAQAQFINSKNDLVTAKLTYEKIIGPLEDIDLINGSINLDFNIPESLNTAIELSIGNNPDLIIAKLEYEQSQQDVKIAIAEFSPTAKLSAESTKSNDLSSTVDERDQDTLKAEITWPLFKGGKNSASLERSKRLNNRKKLLLDNALRTNETNVASAWSSFQSSESALTSVRSQVNAAEIANEGITVEYETGLGRTTLDVIQSNTILLTSRINLANSERNFFLSQLELLKSVGLLNAKYLKIVK
ncbi:TolC family outer membrane protein [Candidatus Pelagibacter sp.]|nr:TolC family outer membrane protein [Candidatus Pelagibacter sp.]